MFHFYVYYKNNGLGSKRGIYLDRATITRILGLSLVKIHFCTKAIKQLA